MAQHLVCGMNVAWLLLAKFIHRSESIKSQVERLGKGDMFRVAGKGDMAVLCR